MNKEMPLLKSEQTWPSPSQRLLVLSAPWLCGSGMLSSPPGFPTLSFLLLLRGTP